MQLGQKTLKKEGIVPLKKMVGPSIPKVYRASASGFSLSQLLFVAVVSALLSAFLVLYGAQVLRLAKISLPFNGKRPAWPMPSMSL
jgi:hypothetical protein